MDWQKPGQRVKKKAPTAILYGRVSHLKTGFRGRRRELREFMKMLRRGDPPALCLTGHGGVGKSTLAGRIADRLHLSGYLVIPLFGELSPDLFIQKTLNALIGAGETEHTRVLKELTDYNEKIIIF